MTIITLTSKKLKQRLCHSSSPPLLLSVSQGQGDQVEIGSFTAEARKCHRPHHPLPREDREEAGEASEVSLFLALGLREMNVCGGGECLPQC